MEMRTLKTGSSQTRVMRKWKLRGLAPGLRGMLPREKDALSGDTKTLESFCARFTRFHNANENAFDAPSTLRSADVRSRGSAVSAGVAPVGVVGLLPPHAASATMRKQDSCRAKDEQFDMVIQLKRPYPPNSNGVTVRHPAATFLRLTENPASLV